MRRGLLALSVTLALGGLTGLASADYIVIVANLGGGGIRQSGTGGGQLGALGGMAGARGMPGMPGGGPAGGLGAAGGGPVGGLGAAGGGPAGGLGIRGGLGAVGGMGMRGGAGASIPPKLPPLELGPDAMPVVVVLEVGLRSEDSRNIAKEKLERGLAVNIHPRWTTSSVPISATEISDARLLSTPRGKAFPTLKRKFEERENSLKQRKDATTDDIVADAEYYLGYGALDRFTTLMDGLLEKDKDHPKVAAYAKVKKALAAELKAPATDRLRDDLLSHNYRPIQTTHYVLLTNDQTNARVRAERMERAFSTFYYWLALRPAPYTLPREKLVAVMTGAESRKDFNHCHETLEATPVVSDSFFAPREGLAVFSTRPLDDTYDRLNQFSKPWWDKGFHPENLVAGKLNQAIPRAILQQYKLKDKGAEQQVVEAATLALLRKALEEDAESAGISHGVSRQLVFASGLVPGNVSVPEWAQFGVASFFETSNGSPFPTVGLPSFEYLPAYRDLADDKQPPIESLELLRGVITDTYFRKAAVSKKPDDLKTARGLSWALGYFLMRYHLPQLQAYFNELSRMPRDVALDDDLLIGCFARAFGCVEASGRPDPQKLRALADRWRQEMRGAPEEFTDLINAIRAAYKEATTIKKTPTFVNPRQKGFGGNENGPSS